MNITPSEVSVRATALADAIPGSTCIVVNRRDLMFDLPALNREENRARRVLPASTAHGVSWDELAIGEELLVDATVLDCSSVRVFDSNDPLRAIDCRSLRHARFIRHCQRLQRSTKRWTFRPAGCSAADHRPQGKSGLRAHRSGQGGRDRSFHRSQGDELGWLRLLRSRPAP